MNYLANSHRGYSDDRDYTPEPETCPECFLPFACDDHGKVCRECLDALAKDDPEEFVRISIKYALPRMDQSGVNESIDLKQSIFDITAAYHPAIKRG